MVAKSDYSFNYLKNSFFQILATGIGFLSLFIVVPFYLKIKFYMVFILFVYH